jgi:hypothetical protein
MGFRFRGLPAHGLIVENSSTAGMKLPLWLVADLPHVRSGDACQQRSIEERVREGRADTRLFSLYYG